MYICIYVYMYIIYIYIYVCMYIYIYIYIYIYVTDSRAATLILDRRSAGPVLVPLHRLETNPISNAPKGNGIGAKGS